MSPPWRVRPSPNFDARRLPVSMVVLHYTGMPRAEEALARLCDPDARVSAHWFIDEDGSVVQLVPEERRAWHAGQAWWRGITDVNSASVGIELQNPGHAWGYRPFPPAQMEALVDLLAGIRARFAVPPVNVVGHSDVAPTRKQDPGEFFDWDRLAALGLALGPPRPLPPDPGWDETAFHAGLARLGYDVTDPAAACRAFQRRFRPARIDGRIDAECRRLLAGLLMTLG
ncbi:MAG: N-acetylmuramoyl-L-alanine amidase [Sphingomonadaceae bacterium]|uniref:N-acetylmuramoyl-L-alanine amidase n=1 Tax=Thermaurantiacus sp. TaxID=2820283 RepID=UPI00298F10CD|nr:N-acetylmuramoyl-L-alanine amidase [Thermaurantiacus sp.]MCS6987138.1 N-acetylmuramoyl-L-alanine amidase [Sphingomonadaceae bacterium]MDW8415828.1 N-acetylmuramoyl-L-alanine amidase [Thermaurantiacus sp.]